MTFRSSRLLPLVSLLLTAGCVEDDFPLFSEERDLWAMAQPSPPPSDETNRVARDARAAAMGEELFHDTGISACNVSCASCHDPAQGYADGRALAQGCGSLDRHAPTLLNVAGADYHMWDGRADRLWAQALLPYLNPAEMGGDPERLRARFLSVPSYRDGWAALFPGEDLEQVSDERLLANFGKVMAAYEVTLTRTGGPFNAQVVEYLTAVEEGTQLSHPLHLGLKTFFRKGQCATCHKGGLLSDLSFHNIGVADTTPGAGGREPGIATLLDSLFNATSVYSDNTTGPAANRFRTLRVQYADLAERARLESLGQMSGAFKTPSLRNVALTAPYMHNGSVATLSEVIDFYDRGGDAADTFTGTRASTVVPLELTPEEKAALLELLELLTDPDAR